MNQELHTSAWESSYSRKENFIFYPKEEIVKFLNRFVCKRNGVSDFTNIIIAREGRLKGLDFGCGIGRQTILLSEFGIDSWGGDISANAIRMANELKMAGRLDPATSVNFFHIECLPLPYEDNFFDIGICDSVLDSMHFDIAKKAMGELDRVISKLLYVSLISSDCHSEGKAEDVFIESRHEQNTIQSYFNFEKIMEMLKDTRWQIKWHNLLIEKIDGSIKNARYHIVLEKRK
jgi:SAM-dependent methyltransferase